MMVLRNRTEWTRRIRSPVRPSVRSVASVDHTKARASPIPRSSVRPHVRTFVRSFVRRARRRALRRLARVKVLRDATLDFVRVHD